MSNTNPLDQFLPKELRGRIVLDYPLDLLLNRACKLADYAEHDLLKRAVRISLSAKAAFRKQSDRAAEASGETTWESYEERLYEGVPKLSGFSGRIGSLVIPRDSPQFPPVEGRFDAATGNILIRGKPGTCKTTLALQCAIRCTRAPNHYSAIFVSLEESSERVLEKCQLMGWYKDAFGNRGIVELRTLPERDGASSTEELAESLARFIRGIDTEHLDDLAPLREGKVILPMLSPRSIRRRGNVTLFQRRYEQLERLLRAFRWLRQHPNRYGDLPQLRVLCIDSLSALADRPLKREEIYRVFDLFTTYGVIGLVTVEADEPRIAESLADVIIELHSDQDEGYALRYLEITKSRHQHQVYGLHPFVVRHLDDYREEREGAPRDYAEEPSSIGTSESVASSNSRFQPDINFFQSVLVYPSIHYLTYSTRQRQPASDRDPKDGNDETSDTFAAFDIGIEGLDRVLTGGRLKRRSIVTVKGPRGAYKSHIARNFLLSGLEKGESCILVHLGANRQFNPNAWDRGHATPWLASTDVYRRVFGDVRQRRTWGECFELLDNDNADKTSGIESRNTSKFRRDVWLYRRGTSSKNPVLVEFDFKPGALLPEQFLKHVRDVFRQLDVKKHPEVRRLVLDDVSLIGTSYPRLRQSRTVGDLFLTAFVHCARYFGLDVVMVGTSGEFAEADAVVRRASTLADSVLTCDFCDVFGDRLIIVTGDGLMAAHTDVPSQSASAEQSSGGAVDCIATGALAGLPQREYGEFVPGVVVPESDFRFSVNLNRLEGLVGFQTGQIHRPGIVLNLFSEGSTLGKYNDEIRTLLECALASAGSGIVDKATRDANHFDDTNVAVREFGWSKSAALHDSLRVLQGNPVDKTVVCALDEFSAQSITPDSSLPATGRIAPGLCALGERSLAFTHSDTNRDFSWDYFREVFWVNDDEIQNDQLATDTIGKKTIRAVPYYSNVLVLVYHEALAGLLERCWTQPTGSGEPRRLISWERLHETVTNAAFENWEDSISGWLKARLSHSEWKRRNLDSAEWRFFDLGDFSSETLSCIVLDAHCTGDTNLKGMMQLASRIESDATQLRAELHALGRLFGLSPLLRIDDATNRRQDTNLKSLLTRIYPYSAFYIAWYTEIRELVAEYPELAPSLRVAALPGGGVRGDWYLGVVQGSVSVALGRRIIEILCGREQDNRRFIDGVGLPTHRNYDRPDNYMAWPRGEVDLSTVLQIHSRARARSRITGYEEVRATLGAIGEQLRVPLLNQPAHEKSISNFLKRLATIIPLVTGAG